MDGVMSQEEINALLNGSADSGEQKPQEEVLTRERKRYNRRDCQYQHGNSGNHVVFPGEP